MTYVCVENNIMLLKIYWISCQYLTWCYKSVTYLKAYFILLKQLFLYLTSFCNFWYYLAQVFFQCMSQIVHTRYCNLNTDERYFGVITCVNLLSCSYERSNSFPTQNVTFKLTQHKLTPTQQIPPQKKIGECTGAGIKPTTFCVQGRRPNHLATSSHGYTRVYLMYLVH